LGSKSADAICGQVRSGETSASKPFDDASINQSASKTRGGETLWDKRAGDLVTGRAAAGV
jgi:hypothetical protein